MLFCKFQVQFKSLPRLQEDNRLGSNTTGNMHNEGAANRRRQSESCTLLLLAIDISNMQNFLVKIIILANHNILYIFERTNTFRKNKN